MVEPDMPQKILRLRIECWITKATRAQARTLARARTPKRVHTHALTLREHTRRKFHISGFMNSPECDVERTTPVF